MNEKKINDLVKKLNAAIAWDFNHV